MQAEEAKAKGSEILVTPELMLPGCLGCTADDRNLHDLIYMYIIYIYIKREIYYTTIIPRVFVYEVVQDSYHKLHVYWVAVKKA